MKENHRTQEWLAEQLGRTQGVISFHFRKHDRNPAHKIPEDWVMALERIDPVGLHRTKTRPEWYDGLDINVA